MTKFYVDAQGRYLGGFDGAEPPIGAIEVATPPDHGAQIWGGSVWAFPLQPAITAAVAATYRDVDGVYADAIGQRGPEYADAEVDARAFKAAGYTGTPSAYVSNFALHNPTGTAQSNQWAADQIIARADAFQAAKLAMRSQRFVSQQQMRSAITQAGLQAAVSTWNSFIAGLRAQLGL